MNDDCLVNNKINYYYSVTLLYCGRVVNDGLVTRLAPAPIMIIRAMTEQEIIVIITESQI